MIGPSNCACNADGVLGSTQTFVYNVGVTTSTCMHHSQSTGYIDPRSFNEIEVRRERRALKPLHRFAPPPPPAMRPPRAKVPRERRRAPMPPWAASVRQFGGR